MGGPFSPLVTLFSDNSEQKSPPKRDFDRVLLRIPMARILPNPNQPRREFSEESLHELMVSIAQLGLIQPLVVRENGGRYELISGERRLRACRQLGLTEMPCIVIGADTEKSAVMAVAENIQRKNLHFLEEAQCYRRLLLDYSYTQESLADKLGKTQAFLSNKLRLLKLPSEVQELLCVSNLTERHARALLPLMTENAQLTALRLAIQNGWTVAQLENHVALRLESEKPKPLRIIRLSTDCRLFLNGIRAGLAQLQQSGMDTRMEEKKTETGLEIRIYVYTTKQPSLF
ncbi:MAG: ParB/RepB/Spo0J family partition protein [Clostridiales bacterium]|nr:ParB/RepB/Spo0J family partition protein [Clostridiales bacterium]